MLIVAQLHRLLSESTVVDLRRARRQASVVPVSEPRDLSLVSSISRCPGCLWTAAGRVLGLTGGLLQGRKRSDQDSKSRSVSSVYISRRRRGTGAELCGKTSCNAVSNTDGKPRPPPPRTNDGACTRTCSRLFAYLGTDRAQGDGSSSETTRLLPGQLFASDSRSATSARLFEDLLRLTTVRRVI